MALSKAEIYQRHKDRYHNDPEYRTKILQQKAEYNKRRRSDPMVRERLNQYNRDNKDYFSAKAKEYNSARPFHYAFRRLKLRAKQNDIHFDLDEEYLISIWTGRCAIMGSELCAPYSTKHQDPNKATVDRIIPSLGYIRGNVQWVSNRANIIKSFGTLEEHIAVVDYIKKHTLPN